jgi:predicted helicase
VEMNEPLELQRLPERGSTETSPHFISGDTRGVLAMPCGTGKTLVFRVFARVPQRGTSFSIARISQTKLGKIYYGYGLHRAAMLVDRH